LVKEMLKGYENKRLKLNTSLRGHDAGSIVRIKTDKDGTPVDVYWRRRLNDAETDGCVEFHEEVKTPAKKTIARKQAED